jgi:hypothetical protein
MTLVKTNLLEDEIIEFLSSAPAAESIIAFEVSDAVRERSHYLMERNRSDSLSDDEREELAEMLRLNHFFNMIKLRARQKMNAQ